MAVPNVLVIEDNPADILLLKGMLEKELGPHHFEVLHDGESALAFIRGFRTSMLTKDPCVIVLDLGLPRHNGITVLEEVRRSPALTHIQVVVISSFATQSQQDRVEALGGTISGEAERPEGIRDAGSVHSEYLSRFAGVADQRRQRQLKPKPICAQSIIPDR